jgi:hypothetical protein
VKRDIIVINKINIDIDSRVLNVDGHQEGTAKRFPDRVDFPNILLETTPNNCWQKVKAAIYK